MPLYRFHIDATVPPQTVTERIRCAVRKNGGLGEYFRTTWGGRIPEGPPFIGSVQEYSFRIRRIIRYRNSFRPLVWGNIVPTPTGARIKVTIFMHPFTLAFMLFWLGIVGRGALMDQSTSHTILWGMFILGIALCIGGFVPEVAKAKRLLSTIVLDLPQ